MEKKQELFKTWERTRNKRVLDNTTLKIKRTFIGLGVEMLEELNQYKQIGETHVVFTNMKDTPDTNLILNMI